LDDELASSLTGSNIAGKVARLHSDARLRDRTSSTLTPSTVEAVSAVLRVEEIESGSGDGGDGDDGGDGGDGGAGGGVGARPKMVPAVSFESLMPAGAGKIGPNEVDGAAVAMPPVVLTMPGLPPLAFWQ